MNIKDIIKTQAISDSYLFNYGTKPYVSWELLDQDLKNGQTIINMLPEIERGLYASGRPTISSVEYSVFIQVGRKWDLGNATYSSLDETFEQKYDNRLVELYGLSRRFVQSIACMNNFEMVSYRAQAEINQYATSLDLISVEFVFRVPEYLE